jgi:hypothetical protein
MMLSINPILCLLAVCGAAVGLSVHLQLPYSGFHAIVDHITYRGYLTELRTGDGHPLATCDQLLRCLPFTPTWLCVPFNVSDEQLPCLGFYVNGFLVHKGCYEQSDAVWSTAHIDTDALPADAIPFTVTLSLQHVQYLFFPHDAVTPLEDSTVGHTVNDEANSRDQLRSFAVLLHVEAIVAANGDLLAATPHVIAWLHPSVVGAGQAANSSL